MSTQTWAFVEVSDGGVFIIPAQRFYGGRHVHQLFPLMFSLLFIHGKHQTVLSRFILPLFLDMHRQRDDAFRAAAGSGLSDRR
jgi:hypothetical protein